MLGVHGLEASLSMVEEIGMAQIEKLVLERSRFLVDAIQDNPKLGLITPADPARHAGIVTFSTGESSLEVTHNKLTEKGIQCAVRAGGIRFSPHFYTPMGQLEEAISGIST